MARDSVWLEVALNGAAGQALQPGIPIVESEIIEQAVACIDAGAAIVHLHAYNDRGEAVEDADIYSRLIEGIKNERDAIVYPTLALGGSLEQRLEPIRLLGERGLLEAGVVDPGSVNITHEMGLQAGMDGIHYPNPDAHIRALLELAEQYGWRPAYAIYEPGFARLGAAFASQFEKLKTPIYRLMFSDGLLFGTKPSEYALEFYARHLAETAPNAPWMVSGLDADISSILEPAIALGAHVRVGLEDAPFGCEASNLELVQQAADQILRVGASLANAEEIRLFK